MIRYSTFELMKGDVTRVDLNHQALNERDMAERPSPAGLEQASGHGVTCKGTSRSREWSLMAARKKTGTSVPQRRDLNSGNNQKGHEEDTRPQLRTWLAHTVIAAL